MIVILVSRASLRPLPFIIFTANFLPNHWVKHIKNTEEKTTQMGEVCYAPPCSFHGRKEFNETKNDHKIFCRDGEEKIDVDETIGKEPTKGEKYSIDGPRSSDDWDELIGSKDHCANASTDSTKKKISQKLLRSPIVF
jgi:hypothetical protein